MENSGTARRSATATPRHPATAGRGVEHVGSSPAPRPSRAHTALGRFGEDVAARWLEDQGYTVVDRNWRCPDGELDLVARHGGWWVAVEVKTRRGTDYGHPFEAITARKLRRLHRLAHQWSAAHPEAGRLAGWRVDAVSVLLPRGGGLSIEVLKDVRP